MANEEAPKRQPISPAVRQRLQKQFEAGSKVAATGNYDYATDMFTQCVLADPGNLLYVSNFVGNLQKSITTTRRAPI